MKNLLVTGAKGQLAHFVREELGGSDAQFVSRAELDLSSATAIRDFFGEHGRFKTILNLAAYTAVDNSEKEPDLAARVNALAPAEIGEHCDRIIHISTDFVFDGEKKTPYTENDKALPLGVYGKTKLEGEIRLMQKHPNAIVVRTSWLYSELPGNFLTKISAYARQKPELRIVSDQRGTPTYAGDLARLLVQVVREGASPGIYHYSNEGETTWYDFATYFLGGQGIATPVHPIGTNEYPAPARRPSYSVLDKSKIKRELNLQIAPWQESVDLCLKRMS
jgi:dTDP-4-dehydrorhamnose reductase